MKVHRGFLAHKRRLDERLESASMQSLKPILAEWGVQTEAENFRSFLLSGDFQFLIALGHSLGGAMSAISGLELAVRTKRPVHVVGIGSAIPGNQKFTEAMDQYITPKGGLRIVPWRIHVATRMPRPMTEIRLPSWVMACFTCGAPRAWCMATSGSCRMHFESVSRSCSDVSEAFWLLEHRLYVEDKLQLMICLVGYNRKSTASSLLG